MPTVTVQAAPRKDFAGYWSIQQFFPNGVATKIEVTEKQYLELLADKQYLAVSDPEYSEAELLEMSQTDAEKAARRAQEQQESAEKAAKYAAELARQAAEKAQALAKAAGEAARLAAAKAAAPAGGAKK